MMDHQTVYAFDKVTAWQAEYRQIVDWLLD
jgi:hypothetical protein